jgi:hypothetical protein
MKQLRTDFPENYLGTYANDESGMKIAFGFNISQGMDPLVSTLAFCLQILISSLHIYTDFTNTFLSSGYHTSLLNSSHSILYAPLFFIPYV